jgi:hypothetical protein
VGADGIIDTVAGGNGPGSGGDGGPARDAQLFRPTDIVQDRRGRQRPGIAG